MRHHGSLTKDEEMNNAAWEAARGATAGAVKVSAIFAKFIKDASASGLFHFQYLSGGKFCCIQGPVFLSTGSITSLISLLHHASRQASSWILLKSSIP